VRLFAHQLAQLFDFFAIVRGRLSGIGLRSFRLVVRVFAVSAFVAVPLAVFSVAVAVAAFAPASPVFESSARSGPQAKSAQMIAIDNVLPIRSSI